MLDAIEAMRVALGPGILLNYVLQGLWHPARRVREVFWQIYSSLYMGSQDALVPYYPTSEFACSPFGCLRLETDFVLCIVCLAPVPEISDERNDYEGRSQMLMMWV